MAKRILSLLTAVVLLTAALFSVSSLGVSAADAVAEVAIDLEHSTVKVGSYFAAEIYLKNITLEKGAIGCDLPLRFDSQRLKLISCEVKYPEIWKGEGEYLGSDDFSKSPFWLRAIPDVLALDDFTPEKYAFKNDKELCFVVAFQALAEGEALIMVESDPTSSENIYVIDTAVANRDGKGLTVLVNISNDVPESSDVSEPADSEIPSESVAESDPESEVQDTDSSESVESAEQSESSEESADAESSESSEAFSESDDSTESLESDVSGEPDLSTEQGVSAEAPSSEEQVSGELSVPGDDSTIANEELDGDDDNSNKLVYIIGVAVLAVIACAVVFLTVSNNRKKAEEEQ